MRQDVKSLTTKINDAMQLCKNVLEHDDKIKMLSPLETGMDVYVEELTQCIESRGRATKVAIRELNEIGSLYEAVENDSTVIVADKVYLNEKIHSLQDLSSVFTKQNAIARKSIEIHLNSLRQESVSFQHNVKVIKSYLKAPDNRTFYG
jgi:predicted RNA-binding protein with PIN domain